MISDEHALALAGNNDLTSLMSQARAYRDSQHRNIISYSRKVFIPLTELCRDVCHYCTFAKTPRRLEQAFLSVEQVLQICRDGADAGCQEALFTLGEKPELRYRAAREALAEMGFTSTIDYLVHVAGRVLEETGLLPHINAGTMTRDEIKRLREVSASMGIMLESVSKRLCQKDMPHYGSPDKDPELRLETLRLAGEESVPFTTGILIGIGETRSERIESLLAIRDLHQRYGHIQEIIIQNFRAKPNTRMAQAPEPDLAELLWTIAVARLIFGPAMNIQAPPNLSPGVLPKLVDAGINDWGGVSPLTPDHVNPEAPWPHLDELARETAVAGKFLEQRLTIYPAYASEPGRWLDEKLRSKVQRLVDGCGFARRDDWRSGSSETLPDLEASLLAGNENPWVQKASNQISGKIQDLVQRCLEQRRVSELDLGMLLRARGADFLHIVQTADHLRAELCGDTVSYVVNRNINYTNVCYFKCQFCAFSKGKQSENLRGRPYDISAEEISRRVKEAWDRGATEVCLQGGIHPDYTGQTYLDIAKTVSNATPGIHVHAFSPLEVWQGAKTLNISLEQFLLKLRAAGLNTLPGTAAEVLHDDVRAVICPDKLKSRQWLQVMETAHRLGFKTTATLMFGHVETPEHIGRHLLSIQTLQQRTGGFTEFVPLPYVAQESPMFRKGNSRPGPTVREVLLVHAVARLLFHQDLPNIQTSWVKLGLEGVSACLQAGANDLGGTLMNESITRAAGAAHGQEWQPQRFDSLIQSLGRQPRIRTTLYKDAPAERQTLAYSAKPLNAPTNEGALKQQRSKKIEVQLLPSAEL